MSLARWSTLVLALLACRGGPAGPTPVSETLRGTGLTGSVLRGPVTPVCVVTRPCDAPFSAAFHVSADTREVAQFASDATGRFSVALPPGTYTVVPDSTAPVFPRFQSRVVTVQPEGVTAVTLEFDTGIR
ncbi:MAG TPA: hypothetical protein VH116_05790 [Gemmatimonadales bacterium]|nr:hypothetical protein [Gemmatimonadales bacterium]